MSVTEAVPAGFCSRHGAEAADVSVTPSCSPLAGGSATVLKLDVKERNNEENTRSLTLAQRDSPCFFRVGFKVRRNERLEARKQKGDKRNVSFV